MFVCKSIFDVFWKENTSLLFGKPLWKCITHPVLLFDWGKLVNLWWHTDFQYSNAKFHNKKRQIKMLAVWNEIVNIRFWRFKLCFVDEGLLSASTLPLCSEIKLDEIHYRWKAGFWVMGATHLFVTWKFSLYYFYFLPWTFQPHELKKVSSLDMLKVILGWIK